MGKNVTISTLPNIGQNYLPKINSSSIFANSLVYDDGSSVLINTTTASAFKLDVNGSIRATSGTLTGALSGTSATFNSKVIIKNNATDSFLQLGNYGVSGDYINNSTLPSTPAGYIITLAPPSTTNYYGGGIGWSEGTNTCAAINVYDDGSSGALGLSFATGTNSSLVERLKISSTGAATFSGELYTSANLYFGNTVVNPASGFSNQKGFGFANSTGATEISANNTAALQIGRYNGAGSVFVVRYASNEVASIASTGAATFSSSVTATGESFITGSDGGGKMLKFTGGTTRFNWMIAAQQNVNNGLEITPSSAAGGSTFSTPAVVITSAGAATFSSSVRSNTYFQARLDGSATIESGAAFEWANTAGNRAWVQQLGASNELFYSYYNGTSWSSPLVTILNSGNVGIGTSSPSDYDGDANSLVIYKSTSTGLSIVTGTTAGGSIFFADGTTGSDKSRGFMTYSHNENSLRLGTDAVERLRITSGGNVLINRTSDISTTTSTSKMVVNGAVNVGSGVTNSSFPTKDDGGLGVFVGSGATAFQVWDDNQFSSARFQVQRDGTMFAPYIGSGAGTYALKWTATSGKFTYDSSSERYKNNIRNSIYGLSDILKLQSRMFEYKDDERTDVGFIAEEVNEVIPELTVKDLDGRPDAVSYDRFVSVLVKAIQELKAEIDTLKK